MAAMWNHHCPAEKTELTIGDGAANQVRAYDISATVYPHNGFAVSVRPEIVWRAPRETRVGVLGTTRPKKQPVNVDSRCAGQIRVLGINAPKRQEGKAATERVKQLLPLGSTIGI